MVHPRVFNVFADLTEIEEDPKVKAVAEICHLSSVKYGIGALVIRMGITCLEILEVILWTRERAMISLVTAWTQILPWTTRYSNIIIVTVIEIALINMKI